MLYQTSGLFDKGLRSSDFGRTFLKLGFGSKLEIYGKFEVCNFWVRPNRMVGSIEHCSVQYYLPFGTVLFPWRVYEVFFCIIIFMAKNKCMHLNFCCKKVATSVLILEFFAFYGKMVSLLKNIFCHTLYVNILISLYKT